MNTLLQVDLLNLPDRGGAPTLARKASAILILALASAGFLVMVLWPVVVRFS